ncbi:MAG: endonuclease/exonuclease/phosphatase family protein [Bacteroidales bacterium]|nr:endonuclease/exonuclease/phosphatase family protein [Bacteroidales bacterium]
MFRKIIRVITILVVLLAVISIISVYVSPASAKFMAVFPFATKYLCMALAAFTVLWIFLNYKFALFLALLTFVQIRMFSHEYSFGDKGLADKADFRVLTYNAREFGILDNGSKLIRATMLDTIVSENPDIVFLQEAYWQTSKTQGDYPTLDELSKRLNAASCVKYRLADFNFGQGGLAVVSRYKILNSGFHAFDSCANGFMFVDVCLNEDTVRMYNCHLQSIMLNDKDVEIDRSNRGINASNKEMAANLYSKYVNAAARRAVQVDSLVASIDSCQYPVFVCGDFNDVPLSYSAFRVLDAGNHLRDSFMERGSGYGHTIKFAGMEFRIDYILHSNEFKCLRHKVLDFNVSDDHHPVVADFGF